MATVQSSASQSGNAAATRHPGGVDTLLARLDNKVQQTGPGRWLACCPAHDDRSPSLSIRELDDGRVLIHCFTGCSTGDVLAAVGMEFCDLYPANSWSIGHANPERRPFNATDVLKAISMEVAVIAAAGGSMQEQRLLSNDDWERLALAVNRLHSALTLIDGGHCHG